MSKKMPALFVSHGSPMNLLLDNKFTRDLKSIGQELPKPKAILMFSAHWTDVKFYLSKDKNPKAIYDFYGFPKELYKITYDAKGAPNLAKKALKLIDGDMVTEKGLDHGIWTVLHHLFPKKDIPVFQVSLNLKSSFYGHYQLGKQLSLLREEGVMFIGSGNATHNLMTMKSFINAPIEKKTLAFGNSFRKYLLNFPQKLVEPLEMLPYYRNVHPSDDHYLPLLPIIGSKSENEKIRLFHDSIQYATLDMSCFIVE